MLTGVVIFDTIILIFIGVTAVKMIRSHIRETVSTDVELTIVTVELNDSGGTRYTLTDGTHTFYLTL
jgi:hypothetical protein